MGPNLWRRVACVALPASLPPSLPDPIPGAIDLLLLLLLLLLILLRVRETKTRTTRTIHILSFLPHMLLPPSSLSLPLSLCGIHAHFSFHPSFCERRAAREGRKERGRGASF